MSKNNNVVQATSTGFVYEGAKELTTIVQGGKGVPAVVAEAVKETVLFQWDSIEVLHKHAMSGAIVAWQNVLRHAAKQQGGTLVQQQRTLVEIQRTALLVNCGDMRASSPRMDTTRFVKARLNVGATPDAIREEMERALAGK